MNFKRTVFLGFTLLLATATFAQKTISGKSKPVKLKMDVTYQRGLPPNLFVGMHFEDANNNGILEAGEQAQLVLTITNNGRGPAQGLQVLVKDNNYDPHLKINDGIEIPFLLPEQKTEVIIPIEAGRDIGTAEHKLEINVNEHFGYDMDPAYLVLNTFAFQEPELVLAGVEIVDTGEGTAALEEDGLIQAGEMVKAKIIVQNIGQNVSPNTRYRLQTTNRNIYLENHEGNLNTLDVGQVKEFWVTISPNKRVETEGQLPITFTLENDYGIGEIKNSLLPVSLNQRPPEARIVSVEPDVESLTRQVARFEYTSNRITANVGNVININQAPPSVTRRPNAIAVLIGVEEYSFFAPAPYAANDVKIFENYCKNVLGINQVFTYTNSDVSGFFFENTFNPDFGELQKAVVKGETEVFVFYSGHGFPSANGENVFLFPADGRLEALEMQGYNLNKFYNNLAAIGAQSVTVFIDACFSGVSRTTESYDTENLVSMRGVRIKPRVENPWETNPNFSVFNSSAFEETSLGFDPSETGLFTYYLCAGLQGKADANGDKKITTGELAAYISANVKATSQKIRGLQSPQFNGNPDKVLCTF